MHKLLQVRRVQQLFSKYLAQASRSQSKFTVDERSTSVMASGSGGYVQPPKFFEESLKTSEALASGQGWQDGMQPIKVLCLHGAGTNNKVMQHQTKDMQKILGNKAVFHFVEGTYRWPEHKVDPVIAGLFGDGPYYGWMDAIIDPEKNETTEMPWGKAMRDPNVWITYRFRDEALQRLSDKIESDGPYDVVMGFSQGSIVTTMLTALYLKKEGKCPWKYNVQFAGFPVRDNGFREEYMQQKLAHPTLLVYGRADPFYDWGITMQRQFEAPLILEHAEEHRIPKDQGVIKRVCEEMLLHCPTTKL